MRGQAASHAVGTRTTAEHEPAYLMRSICDANPKTKCRTIKTECVFICVETKCQRSGEQRRRAWDIGKRTGWWRKSDETYLPANIPMIQPPAFIRNVYTTFCFSFLFYFQVSWTRQTLNHMYMKGWAGLRRLHTNRWSNLTKKVFGMILTFRWCVKAHTSSFFRSRFFRRSFVQFSSIFVFFRRLSVMCSRV